MVFRKFQFRRHGGKSDPGSVFGRDQVIEPALFAESRVNGMGDLKDRLVTQVMRSGGVAEVPDMRRQNAGDLSNLVIGLSNLALILFIFVCEGGLHLGVVHFLGKNDDVFVPQVYRRGHCRPLLQF